MDYCYVEPEVAGGLGSETVMDRSTDPPKVIRLHYEFDGWLGDALLESFPVFILTERGKRILLEMEVGGVEFDTLDVTVSDQFRQLYPNRDLPQFVWLKPLGIAGTSDIATAADGRLVVSRRVLDALSELGISHAQVAPFR